MSFRVPATVAAAILLGAVLTVAGCARPPAGTAGGGSAPATAPTSAPPTTVPPTTAPPTTAPPTRTPTPGTPPPSTTLRPGDNGPQVLALQQRLAGLGYWLGEPDGRYGASTQHAVTAFQKANRLGRDGVAGPKTLQLLATASRLGPRSRSGSILEVDLTRQILLLVVDGRTAWVFDTSTGARPGSTPTGHFRVFRQVDGYDTGPVGTLYRPKYFYRGVAVHGYPNVPPYPASHGCVRVTNAAMDWLWRTGALPIGHPIWVY